LAAWGPRGRPPAANVFAPQLELHCGGVGANCAPGHRSLGDQRSFARVRGPGPFFGDLLLDTLRKTGVDIRGVERSPSLPNRYSLHQTSQRDGQRNVFSAAAAPISLCVLHTFPPVRFFHQLPRILWVTAFSIRDLKKIARQNSCASFIRAAKRVSLDVGMEPSKRIPKKNPPTAPAGGSSLCKQR